MGSEAQGRKEVDHKKEGWTCKREYGKVERGGVL